MLHMHKFDPFDKEDFLRVRKELAEEGEGRLGGSELGAAVGDNPYKSPYALWCEKVGLCEAEDISDREAIKQGVMFEDGVAKRFEQETGRKVCSIPYVLTNDTAPHLFASPDRLLVNEQSGLECKTAKEVVMKKFPQGDFPQAYFDQCACYLKVTGRERWYLAIAVYSTAFKIFLLTTKKEEYDTWKRLSDKVAAKENLTDEESADWQKNYVFLEAAYYIDQDALDACELAAKNFLARVAEGKAGNMDIWPIEEIDGSEATKKTIAKAFPQPPPESVVTFDESEMYGVGEDGVAFTSTTGKEVCDLLSARLDYDETIKSLEAEKAAIDNKLAALMKDKEKFVTPIASVTYKWTAGRETASASAVKDYFKAKGLELPEGLVKRSDDSRSIRITVKKSKKA